MLPNRHSLKHTVRAISLALLLAGAVAPASAEPPTAQTAQVPGFYRMAVGDLVVTALYDGYIDLNPKILSGASARDIQNLLAAMFVRNTPGMQTAVNGFLIHTGKNLVLVDTGTGSCFGPTLGGLAGNIRAAGYDPAQIDTVLLTHLHPDHACGLLDPNGKPAFEHAQVYASQADANFWLNPDVVAKASEAVQKTAKLAQNAVAPYQAQNRFHAYQNGNELPAGIKLVPSPGHTPGHTSYLFESNGQSLLVWGDIVHSHATQFARPDIAIEFDVNRKQAVASRKKLFKDAAANKLWVAGAHMPFPGLGHVRKLGDGYSWVPAEYSPLRTDLPKTPAEPPKPGASK